MPPFGGIFIFVSKVGRSLQVSGEIITLNGGNIGPISRKLYDSLTAIQWGKAEDPFGWSVKVK